jgi:hypothetical protein
MPFADLFAKIASEENPGPHELRSFVDGTVEFLNVVLTDENFSFLWESEPELHELAIDTFEHDVLESASQLKEASYEISERSLIDHGLIGRPMRFKLRVLDFIGRNWKRKIQGQFSVREWLKKIIDAIDAILDSLIDAAGGKGGMIKEFKDAVAALT